MVEERPLLLVWLLVVELAFVDEDLVDPVVLLRVEELIIRE